eukprot:4966919-Prorocentrum_lima.AAC.1
MQKPRGLTPMRELESQVVLQERRGVVEAASDKIAKCSPFSNSRPRQRRQGQLAHRDSDGTRTCAPCFSTSY